MSGAPAEIWHTACVKHGTRAALFLVGALVYTVSIEAEDALAGWFDGVLVACAVILLVLAVRHPVHDVVEPRDAAVRVVHTGGSSRRRVRAILRLEPCDDAVPPVAAPRVPAGSGQEAGWIVARGLTCVRAEQAVAHLAVRGISAVRVTDGRAVTHRVLLHAAPVLSAPVMLTVVGRFEMLPVVGPVSTVVAWTALVFVAYLAIDVCMSRRDRAEPRFSVDGPFTVRLIGMDAEREHDAGELIGALRTVAALGMDEARDLFRTIPTTVAERVTAAEADRYRTALERAGATVEVVGK